MPSKPCPKCNSAMTEGFVIDQTHGSTAVPTWVEGRPQRSVWTGVRIAGKPRFDIATWRCGRCGFLEHYAAGDPSSYDEQRKKAALAIVIVAIVAAVVAAIGAAILASSN